MTKNNPNDPESAKEALAELARYNRLVNRVSGEESTLRGVIDAALLAMLTKEDAEFIRVTLLSLFCKKTLEAARRYRALSK